MREQFLPVKWLRLSIGIAALTLALAAGMAESQQRPRRQYIGPMMPDGQRAFSSAVLVDETLYISGRIAAATKTKDRAEIDNSVRALLDSYVAVLKEAKMTMDDLVNVQVFAPDAAHYEQFNERYKSYVTGPLPARAFIGSGTLLQEGHFEMVGIAVRR